MIQDCKICSALQTYVLAIHISQQLAVVALWFFICTFYTVWMCAWMYYDYYLSGISFIKCKNISILAHDGKCAIYVTDSHSVSILYNRSCMFDISWRTVSVVAGQSQRHVKNFSVAAFSDEDNFTTHSVAIQYYRIFVRCNNYTFCVCRA